MAADDTRSVYNYDTATPTLTLDDIERALRRLGKRVNRSTTRIRTQCPCHQDQEPSLVIDIAKDGKILVHCFAGCDGKQILQVLGNPHQQTISVTVNKEPEVDLMLGRQILSRAWESYNSTENPMAQQELTQRQISHHYYVADGAWIVKQLKSKVTRTDLLKAGLAYEKDNELKFFRAFSEHRVVIPYFRNGEIVAVRSRAVGDQDGPRYLSLRNYPTCVYIARAVYGTELVVVEGEFKAMRLAEVLPKHISVLALPGVTTAWQDLKELCSHYLFTIRNVLFDTELNKPQVDQAARRVAKLIDGRVLKLPLPSGETRMAPDDFINQYGPEALLQCLGY